MILVIGTVRIPEGSFEDARPAMERQLAATRAESGCIRYAYARDVLDPHLIHVSEAWTDEAAIAAHFQAPHMAEWRAAVARIGMTERNLRKYATDEGEPV